MDFSGFNSAEFRQFVQDHLSEDPALLLLKYHGKVDFDLKEAVQQISARQKAAKKLPEWVADSRIIFPASISLEQSSSEETAKFKADSLFGKLMIDLTGGFGVDSYYLSQNFEKAIYCEQNEQLASIANHNLKLLSPEKFEIVAGDGLDFLKNSDLHFDLIFADPARRGIGNQKLYKLQDCQPDVVKGWDLMKSKAKQILLKLSPMLDISQALSALPDIQKITVISVKNEVKEVLLFWESQNSTSRKKIKVKDLGSEYPTFEFGIEEESIADSKFGEVEKFLVEPLSGILKAGAFRLFGVRHGLKKLDPNSHLYTGDTIPEEIPARIFEVIREISPKKQEIKTLFPSGKVNVICRNYVMGAEELKKKLGLKDGGKDFLIGTKTGSGYKVFWCRRVY
ncbi:MAG: class I SAM-dependent methyltransferase [Algoriphagus sp.]|uniref:class I SAM-dependent methyltransferase n=1 Tax=Algoriphagus sp. TaxID=1872435 RepID=UPI00272FFB1B|nr:class I SAM-dependent methyltransferase [Algoriphagus sp.]MDP2041159.1 class I SAM-dependent methyltransferase [Algoriphagus sp.]MDP3471784.1 class I SAM-dependent methyltransferase [Algoriphagus sp.]